MRVKQDEFKNKLKDLIKEAEEGGLDEAYIALILLGEAGMIHFRKDKEERLFMNLDPKTYH